MPAQGGGGDDGGQEWHDAGWPGELALAENDNGASIAALVIRLELGRALLPTPSPSPTPV
jgi:hypothetical protein